MLIGNSPKPYPMEIEFNYHARGFYCPNCNTGVKYEKQICPFCGQELTPKYIKKDEDKNLF